MFEQSDFYDLIIVGAGPAGLFAGINAGNKKLKISIIEKNASAGKKLLISGSGKCNITHKGDSKNFIDHYGDKKNFVKHSLLNFKNIDLINFFEERNLKMVEMNDGKIFPKTLKSTDVLNILLNECKKLGVTINYNESVETINKTDNGFKIKTDNKIFHSKSVIIATGGKSYPLTGSTGDGYNIASKLGHNVTEVSPSLTSITIKDYKFKDCSGVSLTDVKINLYRNNKKIKETVGDVLFTHKGLSGPGILDFSRYIKANDIIKIKLINNVDREDFEKRILFDMGSNGKKTLKKCITQFEIPESIVIKIFEIYNISIDLILAELDKKTRKLIVDLLFDFPFEVNNLGDFNEAMATRGGINTDEINPRSMESKIFPDLYFAGEVIDVDGDTGGYNLQFAFSSGALAGKSIADKNNHGEKNEDFN
ncbi:MAG TPA: NAD(P)/FAD-dependent oxidoreductase [Spirochaetota bacterium]|nr:NAD(P)/FAD-dependent oxidoreductase [Spirochaetota bacterium]